MDADIVWFTSSSVVSRDSFTSTGYVKRQVWFGGSIFVYSAISPRHGSPGWNDFRLSMPSLLFSRFSLGSFNPRVDALISLRPSWNSGCRPNKVWRDRWEKFLRLKSGGFSPVYPPFFSRHLFESRGLPFSRKIRENGGSLSQFSSGASNSLFRRVNRSKFFEWNLFKGEQSRCVDGGWFMRISNRLVETGEINDSNLAIANSPILKLAIPLIV